MITAEQQKWLDHLSDTDQIKVVAFDPTCEEKFIKIKETVQKLLGSKQSVLHRGASSLKISGQDEIDIYVPVAAKRFNEVVNQMKAIFDEPRSYYENKRARFVTFIEKKHIDIFVVNETDEDWLRGEKFHAYLLTHPETLDAYRLLKEKNSGQSVREFYRQKIEFINDILAKN